MFCLQSSVICPPEDRRVRFAHARQKLLLVGKAVEDVEKSPITQESFHRTWEPCSSMFCLQSSVICPPFRIRQCVIG
ncbi:hypothetical protein BES34_002055 [Leptospira inadai serovar Lyme]|uniref:Uncharacterized protein n=1 Tax=Leptospira inadai serovar Lyme TaxID=293084 RepID=A0ABX4YN79_9LEPT|nr:hypothetical protein BES34_002055 [Leptospira inadai serovar Lyme]